MKIAFDERVKENADLLFHPKDQWQYQNIFNYDFGFGEVDPCYVVNSERNSSRHGEKNFYQITNCWKKILK